MSVHNIPTDSPKGQVPIVWATPRADEVWRVYIGGKIKVRELNSGRVEVATEENEEWREV